MNDNEVTCEENAAIETENDVAEDSRSFSDWESRGTEGMANARRTAGPSRRFVSVTATWRLRNSNTIETYRSII